MYAAVNKVLLIFIFWIFGSIQSSAFARETIVVEGSFGGSNVAMYSPTDDPINLSGKTAQIRLHFPVNFFTDKKKIFAFTLGTQAYDGKMDGPASGQVQLLYYTSMGLGFSYRYHFLIMGAEYQLANFRQSTVGTSSAILNYSVAMPQVYGGILYRMGALGIGAIYSYKAVDLTPAQTKLSTVRPYHESSILMTITYHFDGTLKQISNLLFSNLR